MRIFERLFLLVCILGTLLGACQPPGAPVLTPTVLPPAVTVAPSPRAISVTPFALASATAAPEALIPTPGSPATASLPPEDARSQSPSVILVCWDGVPAEQMATWLADGTAPNFARVAQSGRRAAYATSTDPSLTAAALAAMATGSWPRRTGLVSNAFHNANDSFYWYRSGFSEPVGQGELVWVAAERAGLTTANVFFAGSSPAIPGQAADYTIGYGQREAYSEVFSVNLTPASAWPGEAAASFSPPYEGSFSLARVARVYFYLTDSQDDQRVNYDTLFLNRERNFSPDMARLQVGGWAPLVLVPSTTSGADFLLQKIEPAAGRVRITLFHSAVNRNTATPRLLLEALNRRFGFFPAEPDTYALDKDWITPEQYLQMLERAERWRAQVTGWVYSTYHPDLMFAYQEGLDAAGHAFLLKDSTQPGYSPEKSAAYLANYRQAAQAADQALGDILQAIDLQATTLLLVSDHGMAPAHTNVYVNTVLEQAGLLKLDSQERVVVKKTQAFAIPSGGAVHIYINLAGHEKDGWVPESDYGRVQDQIVSLLSGLTDPASGQPVFARVLRLDELAALGLDHPNSGDVFAQAAPGYNLDGWRGRKEVFGPATGLGQHGYDRDLPAMHGFFIAAGGGVPADGMEIPAVSILDYAPTIAALLKFTLGPQVDGTRIGPILAP